MTTTRRFRISAKAGAILGEYSGENEKAALEQMAIDAGHPSYADVCEVTGAGRESLDIEEITYRFDDSTGSVYEYAGDAYLFFCHYYQAGINRRNRAETKIRKVDEYKELIS